MHYAPYGELVANQRISGFDERFKFTGKERDAETGYDYFRARYYWPVGIWTSVDSLTDKYIYNSLYVYCEGNPIKYVDPDGNFPVPIAVVALAQPEVLVAAAVTVLVVYAISVNKQSGNSLRKVSVDDALNQVKAYGSALLAKGHKNINVREGYKEQQRRERRSSIETANIKREHQKMVLQNTPGENPDPNNENNGPKRDASELGIGTLIGIGVGYGGAIYSNLKDNSKPQNETKPQQVQQQEQQEPQFRSAQE